MTEKEKNVVLDEFRKHQEEIKVLRIYEVIRKSQEAKLGKK